MRVDVELRRKQTCDVHGRRTARCTTALLLLHFLLNTSFQPYLVETA